MSEPFVSVIVPHYRDMAGLERCLTALERQTFPSERFEIVVADNCAPDPKGAIERVIGGRARLVHVSDKGAGLARNGGVAVAKGEILAFTDSDCAPDRMWIEEGVAALAAADFVGGAMRVEVDSEAGMSGAEAFETVFAFDNANYVNAKGFTVTANLFCRRDVYDAVGGFRNGVSEDLEWCQRARAAGYQIGYAEQAIVGHPARRTWTELLAKWRRLNSEAFELSKDRQAGRIRWFLRSLALPLSAVAHTPRVLASERLTTMEQRLSALGVLYRLRLWRSCDGLRLLYRGGGVS